MGTEYWTGFGKKVACLVDFWISVFWVLSSGVGVGGYCVWVVVVEVLSVCGGKL